MEMLFGYYFGGVLRLSLVSGIIYCAYLMLISDYMSAKYPDEYQDAYDGHLWDLTRIQRILKWAKQSGDEKLNRMRAKCLFFLYFCTGTGFAFLLGMVAFIVLKATT